MSHEKAIKTHVVHAYLACGTSSSRPNRRGVQTKKTCSTRQYFKEHHPLTDVQKCKIHLILRGVLRNLIALAICGLEKGDEVLTAACTFNTVSSCLRILKQFFCEVVAPIIQLGLEPVFCDIESDCTFVPTVDQIMKKVTDKTKVIMMPNLAGSPIDWKKLREAITEIGRSDIVLLEDSCDMMVNKPGITLSN